MPRYVYQCSECEEIFEVVHSFNETIETCSQLDEHCECDPQSSVFRIPQNINFMNKQEQKIRVGQVVDEHIKNAKDEVKTYKKEMINWNPKKSN
tara:strand:- start:360 stop:641 length:282 start_codon:yes stop_codon:yes gene_type:complete